MSNELGHLASSVGNRMASGTGNIFLIHKNQVPEGRKATYSNAVRDYSPLKDDPYRLQLTVGGNSIIYTVNPSDPAASLLD